ncbi:MAG: glutathione S-transferase N-terminal domain-containing protein [Candidatus Omnitrophica bacterium]|nr:glutathione S-transferase N-terminal domain-containing protein [Candidatus Omnitrophota bacterium]
MKLLYTPRSPYARKVRVVAIEKGIDLELVSEDLVKKSPGLVKANPLGKIPTLILDNGQTIFDSPVICEYLDNIQPSPALIPKDPQKRLAVLILAAAADGLMDVTVAMFMEKARHPRDFNADFIAANEVTVKRCFVYFDGQVDQLKELNIASIGLASAIGYLNFRMPQLWRSTDYPRLARWYEAFSKRPSMKETVPREK